MGYRSDIANAADVASSDLSAAFASANRGALTTIFTPPATCLTETTLVSYLTIPSSDTAEYLTTKIFINHFSWGDPACYPPTVATIDGFTRWDNGYYYCRTPCYLGSKVLTSKLSTRNMSEWMDVGAQANGERIRILNNNRQQYISCYVLSFVSLNLVAFY